MKLKLTNGILRVVDGGTGGQYSANVKVSIDSDMTGYTSSLLCKYTNSSGTVVDGVCTYADGYHVVPAAAYAVTQVIMLVCASTKGTETVNSQPLYVRIVEGANGSVTLPTDATTWQSVVDSYCASKLSNYATSADLDALEERVEILEESGGGGGGGGTSEVTKTYVDNHDASTLTSAKSYTDTECAKKSDTTHNHDSSYSAITHTHTGLMTADEKTHLDTMWADWSAMDASLTALEGVI